MELTKAMQDLSDVEKTGLKRWTWALNSKNVNAPPLWSWFATLLLTPLIVYLFLLLAGFPQPNSFADAAKAWLVYTACSFVGAGLSVLFTPILKLYVYGPAKGNMMPRISLRREQVVKGAFFVFGHLLGAVLSGVFFVRYYDGAWPSDLFVVWTVSWAMAVASLVGIVPFVFTLVAKIKLVGMVRARKRLENGDSM